MVPYHMQFQCLWMSWTTWSRRLQMEKLLIKLLKRWILKWFQICTGLWMWHIYTLRKVVTPWLNGVCIAGRRSDIWLNATLIAVAAVELLQLMACGQQMSMMLVRSLCYQHRNLIKGPWSRLTWYAWHTLCMHQTYQIFIKKFIMPLWLKLKWDFPI